ncbi:P-loop containing nucleoside triphosphate hydrolase protein [Pseudomassariella vexata]|uniref:p-loop containing nucleoside triphosphate hydrolase protein n=1 Tax=Pseudomassariella vexata TaxID=1141098 RepID=A0A1Y2EJB8_9PEZI|nr:P-loop containing nucleoside triphosphate hydrolase protein [Pseudomassariella vexata]ORY71659.1 P-loop containing nucleoside triphosphate hydrolase protein [Pseudomassariella vexata]
MGSVDDETSSVVMVTPAGGSDGGAEEAVNCSKKETSDSKETADTGDAGEKEKKDTDSDSDSDSESDDKQKDKIIVGMVADRKDLYQVIDKYNQPKWTERCPEDLEEAAENEETLKYAVLVRNKRSCDSRKKLEIDSVVIQSPLLKEVLRDVLKDYPGVTTTLARLTFVAPFKPFVHRWEELTAALDGDYDETTKSHLKLLHTVLFEELKDIISATKDYIKNKVITYEHVWTIFQPGTIIFASRYGRPVTVRLHEGQFTNHCKYGPCYLLKCDRLDWDGSKFGYDLSQHIILPFAGTLSITDLDCFPLAYHSDQETVTATLIARGALFERLAGYHYKAYRGNAIEQKEWGPAKITVDCRVVIDAYAHGKANPNQQPSLKPLQQVKDTGNIHSSDPDDGYSSNSYNDFDNDRDDDIFVNEGNKPLPLSEEQLLLCTPIVKGYALKTKKWLEFFVDEITEIVFNERAFECLVLPEGHKSLILAFAQSQIKNKDAFDDVISGKGKGIIMLLSGGPGIGKTLTAESVAEDMQVPLYMMSAGDLGSASWEIETNLNQVLEMVAKWNAVLLLDECDVFLETRSTHDLDRNRIVSIFLRTLEYYEGILFLTTNRVKDMDEAFHSRIHISLEYPALDESARKAVWTGFLDRSSVGNEAVAAKHELTEEDVDKLARLEMNGRVIKNVLKTSHLLACHKGEMLAYKHLKTVLQIEGYAIED